MYPAILYRCVDNRKSILKAQTQGHVHGRQSFLCIALLCIDYFYYYPYYFSIFSLFEHVHWWIWIWLHLFFPCLKPCFCDFLNMFYSSWLILRSLLFFIFFPCLAWACEMSTFLLIFYIGLNKIYLYI